MIILRNPCVGYWNNEPDYDRRLEAYNEMMEWWYRTVVVWGINLGRLHKNDLGIIHKNGTSGQDQSE